MWSDTRFNFGPSRVSSTSKLAMNDEALRKRAPSIFAQEAWERMTDKYLFIPTIDVVNAMRENGFMPVRAMQSRSRIEGKENFTKHMVVFRDVNAEVKVGEVTPEIALVNSHDGTSSYQLHAALYRWICGNGLLVADTTLGSIRCRHSRKLVDEIIEGTNTLIREVPTVAGKVEHLKSIVLDPAEQMILAEEALSLRYDEVSHRPIKPAQLLDARRSADKEPTLWNVFNRIEENMIKGGLRGRTATDQKTTTRAVQGVSENVRLEKALWSLTDRMAALKTGTHPA